MERKNKDKLKNIQKKHNLNNLIKLKEKFIIKNMERPEVREHRKKLLKNIIGKEVIKKRKTI